MAYRDESYYKYYIIYKTTCNINNKFYVGQHRTNDLNDTYLGSGKLLNEDIDKYGPQNFTREILFVYDNFDDMNNKEIEIVTPEFVAREDTYNMIVGGQIDDYQARRLDGLRAVDKEKNNPNFSFNPYKNKTPEEIKKIVEKQQATLRQKRLSGEIKPSFLGKHHTKETKEKLSLSHKNKALGKDNHRFGTHWWKDPNDKTKSLPIKEGDPVPEGWIRGRWITDEQRQKSGSGTKGKIEITDGIHVKFITSLNEIPDGWHRGTCNNIRSNKAREKMSVGAKHGVEIRRKKNNSYERIKEYYDFWINHTWKEFVQKFDYKHTPQNFYQQCKSLLGSYYNPKFKKTV